MKFIAVCSLALAVASIVRADPYADSVVSYTPGTGINASFESPGAALGAPVSTATITAPPFSNTQIVGVGNGGQLTLEFNTPITNDPVNHVDGVDFTIFGNEFFTLSSGTISGIFNHTGLSVWVSQDNVNYYQLNTTRGADDLFPTNGAGNPQLPLNTSLALSNFTGDTTAQALSLYDGSAGGASYSISWAEDSNGDSVDLPSISYVRIEGTGGFGYIDAVSSVEDIPEPSGAALLLSGAIVILLYQSKTRRKHMKKTTAILCAVAALIFTRGASAQTFDMSNIQYWVGSGTNESAFVVAWNDGKTPDSLVWGYKWDAAPDGSSPTVLAMMQAIEASDSRFEFTPHPLYNDPSGFYAIYSVYYDLTGLGGTPVVGTPGNVIDPNTGALGTESGYPPNPGDHYAEGWTINGFWDEFAGIGNPYDGGSWTDQYPTVSGVAFDTLSNGSWSGLSFSTDLVNYTAPDPAFPTAVLPVPEPSGIALVLSGGAGMFAWRRRRR